MEQFDGSKKPEMDAVDREAHEMFVENAADAIQEALHIKRAINLINEQIENGTLNQRMTVEEMIDVLEAKKEELIGGDDEITEDADDENEESEQ